MGLGGGEPDPNKKPDRIKLGKINQRPDPNMQVARRCPVCQQVHEGHLVWDAARKRHSCEGCADEEA